MNSFQINEQVLDRRPIRNNLVEVRIGTILAFKDRERSIAVVSFPVSNTRAEIPVSKLESVQSRFGRAFVQWNPSLREVHSGR